MADRNVRYGGNPRDLPNTALPTYGDIARCFYKVFDAEKKLVAQVNLVRGQLENSWKSCCPEVPVLAEKSVQKKLLVLCEKVKKINRPKQSARVISDMDSVKDKLFDISACKCVLPKVACDHNRVQCRRAGCPGEHFLCECLPESQVPVAEREYLSDQRSKIGTHGGVVHRRMANFAFVQENDR